MQKVQRGSNFYRVLGNQDCRGLEKYFHKKMESVGISYSYKMLIETSHHLQSHKRVGGLFVCNDELLKGELI